MKHWDMHIFGVLYLIFSDISIWQLQFPFCGVRSGAMASSSTMPRPGKAMVSLSRVHGFILYVAEKGIDFLRKVLY